MKVLIYLNSLAGGGAERVLLIIAEALASTGVEVELVVNHREGGLSDAVPATVPCDAMEAEGLASMLRALYGQIRLRRPDVVLSATTYANLMAIVAGRLAGVPVVITEVTHPTAQISQATRPRKLSRHYRWIYPRAHRIIAVSKGVKDDLHRIGRYGPDKVAVIYNPVVPSDIDRLTAEAVDHAWLSNSDSLPVVMGMGRLEPVKDFETLIRAMAIVNRTRPAKLLILGEGGERDRLLTLANELGIADRVELPGFVENRFAWLAKADVFVSTSLREGFGNAIVEAMACGLPIVATDCPSGPAEILEGGRYGKLTPTEDPSSIACAILLTLSTSGNATALRKRAVEFDIATSISAYSTLLHGCV